MTTSMLRRCAPLALWALLMTTGAARAADSVYVQYACHLPGGRPAPADRFVPLSHGGATAENYCKTGGGLTLTLPDGGAASPTDARWTYTAPNGTSIDRVTMSRVARNISAEGAESRRIYFVSDDNGFLDSCGLSAACPELRDLEGAGSGSSVVVGVSCNTDPCFGPSPGPALVSIDRLAISLSDGESPTLNSQPAGTLFAEGPVDGTRSVTVSASDVGGGVFTAALMIDGVEGDAHVLDANGGACAKPFASAVPCKNSALGVFDVDTIGIPDGEHVAAVVVRDATEMNETKSPPVKIQVQNHPAPSASDTDVPVGSGQAPAGVRRLKLVGRLLQRGVIRQVYGRSKTLRGKLVDTNGQPATNEAVTVFSVFDGWDAKLTRIGTTRTNSAGKFEVLVPPGPNRRILLRSAFQSWTLKVHVPAPIHLEPSRTRLRNKQKLTLVAHLKRAKAPARSADVAFQVLIGHTWRTFARRAIRSDGRARIRHRFRVTYQRLTYRFRAVIIGRRAFPFSNAVSQPVQVRVN